MSPAQKLAEKLIGTADYNCEIRDEIDALSKADRAELDELVFVCDSCDWWCSMDEAQTRRHGFRCEDCSDDDGFN